MKIDIVRTEERMSLSVDGNQISMQQPQLMFSVGPQVMVMFQITSVGIAAGVACNGMPTKEQIFRGGAGVEGWILTAKQLEKDINDVFAELEKGPLPGCSLELKLAAPAFFIEPNRIATANPPGKQLVSATGSHLTFTPKRQS